MRSYPETERFLTLLNNNFRPLRNRFRIAYRFFDRLQVALQMLCKEPDVGAMNNEICTVLDP